MTCFRCGIEVAEDVVCPQCHPLTAARSGQVIDPHLPRPAAPVGRAKATHPCKRHSWVEAEVYGGRMGRRCERCETEEAI